MRSVCHFCAVARVSHRNEALELGPTWRVHSKKSLDDAVLLS